MIRLRLSMRRTRSNRTFMELKWVHTKTLCGLILSSNRTFMELKCEFIAAFNDQEKEF